MAFQTVAPVITCQGAMQQQSNLAGACYYQQNDHKWCPKMCKQGQVCRKFLEPFRRMARLPRRPVPSQHLSLFLRQNANAANSPATPAGKLAGQISQDNLEQWGNPILVSLFKCFSPQIPPHLPPGTPEEWAWWDCEVWQGTRRVKLYRASVIRCLETLSPTLRLFRSPGDSLQNRWPVLHPHPVPPEIASWISPGRVVHCTCGGWGMSLVLGGWPWWQRSGQSRFGRLWRGRDNGKVAFCTWYSSSRGRGHRCEFPFPSRLRDLAPTAWWQTFLGDTASASFQVPEWLRMTISSRRFFVKSTRQLLQWKKEKANCNDNLEITLK